MKSQVLSVRGIWKKINRAAGIMRDDLITVFAAQASFFVIISLIPFVILLAALLKYVVDVEQVTLWLSSHISGEIGGIAVSLVSEAVEKSGIPLVSFTAAAALWASSRGINSVLRGVSAVYGNRRMKELFLIDILRSLIYTAAFVVLLVASCALLVFGGTIKESISEYFPIIEYIYSIGRRTGVFIFLLTLTLFFALVYKTAAGKGRRISKSEYHGMTGRCPRGFVSQFPGALFSASVWMLFSYFYSLYIGYFPGSSYIYGSLAAVALMMLWLYTCMLIMLLGAEINKYIFLRKAK